MKERKREEQKNLKIGSLGGKTKRNLAGLIKEGERENDEFSPISGMKRKISL